MITTTNGKKFLNLAASIVVTAALIVAWHFLVPLFAVTNLVKYISYAVLLFGVTWILDAVFAFVTGPDDQRPAVRACSIQNTRALVGMIVYLLYSALANAAVAVLFNNGGTEFDFPFPAVEKCAFAFIGFCIFLANSLSVLTSRKWTGVAYAAVPVVGVVLYLTPINSIVNMVILSAITLVISYIDAVKAYGKTTTSATNFVVWQLIYLAVLSAVMLVRFLTPINSGGRFGKFLLSAVVNLVIAVVVDLILLVITKAFGAGASDQSEPVRTNAPAAEPEKELAGSAK